MKRLARELTRELTGGLGLAATAFGLLAAPVPAGAADVPALSWSACRLAGVPHEVRCGVLRRPLDPARPQGVAIDLHVAVLPALARNKLPDPVFFFAGGPGQSAIDLAGPVAAMLARFRNRRDLVLIDQRGTGRSAPLRCEDSAPTRPLREMADMAEQVRRLAQCRQRLQTLPHGDLRFYTTAIAMADAEAVRQAMGLGPVNVVGGSYGTRAALDYLRQYPASVRRAVIDGVAPPDMVMVRSLSADGQAAFEALLTECAADSACRTAYPRLREDWRALLTSLPRSVRVAHPTTGETETLTLTRDMVAGLVRQPLYVPAMASAVPFAVQEAAAGRFEALFGLASAMSGGNKAGALATGMHFSVVCAEDLPRIDSSRDAAGDDGGTEAMYRTVCADWPRGEVPADFYTLPRSPAPVLLMSGAIDPVTPPRHGERVARSLGPLAVHRVVPHAGHGVMGLGCLRDLVFRFVDVADAAAAVKGVADDSRCATALPRPPAFRPVRAASATPAAREEAAR